MTCNALGMKCDELQCFESFGYSLRMVQTGPQGTVGERTVKPFLPALSMNGGIAKKF
jgi:hypothetical protein